MCLLSHRLSPDPRTPDSAAKNMEGLPLKRLKGEVGFKEEVVEEDTEEEDTEEEVMDEVVDEEKAVVKEEVQLRNPCLM